MCGLKLSRPSFSTCNLSAILVFLIKRKITGGNMKRLKNVIILICSVSFLYGCALAWIGVGAGVGIGAYKFVEGRLEREYPLSYSRAWDATNSALENLQISISNSIKGDTKGNIDSVRKDGKRVLVSLKDRGQGVTTISVRVGLLGDRGLAEEVHNEIARAAGIR
jgi:hypothetical protein